MPKETKQAQAARYIRGLLTQRGFNISLRHLILESNQEWMVIESRERQIGIDAASGIWVKASSHDDWRCLEKLATVSSAIEAIEFLISDIDGK